MDVIREILKDINPYVEINDDTDLIEEQVLDSVGMLVLLTELEDKFEIEISLEEVEPEQFKNIKSIMEMVKSKLEEK